MWAYESVFYQIYPLGFCGAPFENDGVLTPRIRKVIDWIPHIKNLDANAIYFSPVFESDTHGYRIIHGHVICTIRLESFALTSFVRISFLNR